MELNNSFNTYCASNDRFFIQKKMNNYFPRKIWSKQKEVYLNIESKNSKLLVTCYYEKNYFKHTFSNSFSLKSLKEKSNYFNIFDNVDDILKEIIDNKSKKSEYIQGDEDNDNSIKVVIPVPLSIIKEISFELKRVEKSLKETLAEQLFIIKRYEFEDRIFDINQSKILLNKEAEKKAIKFWISPNKSLSAILLYPFHNNINVRNNNEKLQFNQGDGSEIRKFHNACDNKKKILLICKSKNEIFGGYTPLSFDSSDTYKSDEKSFLFSLNKFEKYPKNSTKKTRSIYCYRNYGPCFYDDFLFLKNNIDTITFSKTNYLTVENWVNKDNCYENTKGVMIEDIEIFQIKEKNFNYEDIKNAINNNSININNNYNININNIINNNEIKFINESIILPKNRLSLKDENYINFDKIDKKKIFGDISIINNNDNNNDNINNISEDDIDKNLLIDLNFEKNNNKGNKQNKNEKVINIDNNNKNKDVFENQDKQDE